MYDAPSWVHMSRGQMRQRACVEEFCTPVTTSVRPHTWMLWKQRFHASLVEADDWCWSLGRRRGSIQERFDPENEERGEAADWVPHHEVSEFRTRNRFAELSEDSDEESVESAIEDTGVVVPHVGSRVIGQAVAVPASARFEEFGRMAEVASPRPFVISGPRAWVTSVHCQGVRHPQHSATVASS